jgi:dipeptidyl aminopeptidase/acylaminoacyl peptidase
MLQDHVSALQQLGESRPYIDLERVGIYGISGGGFATARALFDYPEFFKVGVAANGDHEWRSYSAAWGERWHGPIDEADYDKVFSATNVNNLQGKLLLMHGELDDNVHPANTLRVVDALIKANKRFDMLIMPNGHHGVFLSPYFQRVTQYYFLEHLAGKNVPSGADFP